jgi:hypothetical protein
MAPTKRLRVLLRTPAGVTPSDSTADPLRADTKGASCVAASCSLRYLRAWFE